MVVEFSKNARATGSAASAGARAETVKPGRPFFMKMGALQASTAPAANNAASSGSISCGLMSSMLLSSRVTEGAESGRASPSACPSITRSKLGRSASSLVPAPRPWAARRRGGMGPKRSTTVARMAAPVGVVSSPSPSARTGSPASSSAVAGAGTATLPWAVRTAPVPRTGGLEVMAAGASQAMAAAAPTMSAIES
jgi:hypothetical protein